MAGFNSLNVAYYLLVTEQYSNTTYCDTFIDYKRCGGSYLIRDLVFSFFNCRFLFASLLPHFRLSKMFE